MLMPSIFGENLFDDFFDSFPFYDNDAKNVEKKLYGRKACLLYTSVTRASEIWRDTTFFSGCVHDTNTACLSVIQLLLLFLDFLVRLRTVSFPFRIQKDISAGY